MRLPACLAICLLLACSSSSPASTATPAAEPEASGPALGGSARSRTCKNEKLATTRTAADDVCDRCDAVHCWDESAAAIGTDPDAFGGACGEILACACACEAGDRACLGKCPLPSDACNKALAVIETCESAHCAAECAKD